MRVIIWGGILASPLIGLVAGLLYLPAYRFPVVGRVLFALLTLYVSAAFFGLAVGLYDAARDIPGRIEQAVVLQAINATLWGVTFTGYVLILWPILPSCG